MSSAPPGRLNNFGGTTYNRKGPRPKPPIYSGVPGTAIEKNVNYMCPVCSKTIKEAHMTRCGHSFCLECIKTCVTSLKCPKCNYRVESMDEVFPNFALNDMIVQYEKDENAKRVKAMAHENGVGGGGSADAKELVQQLLTSNAGVDIGHVDVLLELLVQKKRHLEFDTAVGQNNLLTEFLERVQKVKLQQLGEISQELKIVNADLERVQQHTTELQGRASKMRRVDAKMSAEQAIFSAEGSGAVGESNTTVSLNGSGSSRNEEFGFNFRVPSSINETSVAHRTRKLEQHSADLQRHYFVLRQHDLLCSTRSNVQPNSITHGHSSSGNITRLSENLPNASVSLEPEVKASVSNTHSAKIQPTTQPNAHPSLHSDLPGGDTAELSYVGLDEFRESLAKFAKFSTFRPLASLNYTNDLYNISSIVSSIDFDKDSDFFAIAGVTKKIKIFEYSRVISDLVDTHYPVEEMVCTSKISCVTWSSYYKSRLASSDYEGTVTLWDAFANTKTHIFQEHEKRAWCVDFNRVDPKLVASGSDDGRVKLWSVNVPRSVRSIEAKANVCCVQFNPTSRYNLAFGCADHCVHYYDLRNDKRALATFSGHRKAVSYAKFVSGEEIVSASTDSQLKMWNVAMQSPACVRTFTGHTNEKNFVGLATDGEYIACGSEDNKLCVYYKGLSRDLFSYKFDAVRSSLERGRESTGGGSRDEESGEFVSAVAWRPGYNVVVAANSQGVIKVLELV